ncbi:MAG TPA: hypothetical protein VHC97_04335 [Thermoanaerobaculia bacterium]|nr:hypothetical protein [Thermoanaerobaculia bacterium]
MVRLRSALASVYIFALLLMTASAARAQEPNWELIPAPNDGTTASSGTPDITKHLYVLRNDAGINESPLPDTIKEDLLPPPDPGGTGTISIEEEAGDYAYIVSQEIAEGIEASEQAGQLTPEIAAIAEPEDEETSSSSVGANSIFGGSCATRDQTLSRIVDLNGSDFNKTFPPKSGFSGSVSMVGQLQGSVTAQLHFGLKRKNILGFCVPYGVKFYDLHAFGNATSSAGLTVSGNFDYHSSSGPSEILNRELYGFTYRIGPIPIKITINAVMSGGYDLTATASGTINYNGTHVATGSFDYTCTLDDCTGTNTFENTSPTGSGETITGQVEGRIKPVPYLDFGVRAVVLSDSLLYAQVGIRPYFLGDLWGYLGNTCGDADGDGNGETVRALTFDLDRRIDITGELKILTSPKKKTLKTGAVKHVSFWDLGNSTAMQPQLQGPGMLEVRDPGAYKVRMRSCWPYTDQVTYQLNWGDGSAVQTLQGAPATEVTASHTWTEAGSKTVTATSDRDAHGRALNQSTSRTIDVKAPVPLTVTVTQAPASATYGNPITLTATTNGGHAPTIEYTLGRRRVGTADWLPSPLVFQTSNVLTWTPTAADEGSWELAVGVRDRNTPSGAAYGVSSSAMAGTVQVVAPLTVSCSAPNPATVTYGNPVTWTATTTGGTPGTIQFLLSRQLVGTSSWISTPWQPSNTFSWTPTSADVGTWQVFITVKDVNTPADPGYTASCNGGQAKVVAPLSLSVTPSPAQTGSGNTVTWTATATGGTPASTQYALFRRRAGATAWTPDVTAPAWQTSNVLSWTTGTGDAGTWEIIVWVKDGNTPANANTYGYAAYANAGPIEVKAPLAVTITPSPAYSTYGNAITWTATATGGDTATIQYAFGRRRPGATAWIPDPLVWQSGNVLSWTPTSADVGSWEIAVGVRDRNTPPGANGLGYSAAAVAGTVQVVAPLSVTITPSPATSVYGNAITWTATASGGVPATTKFALFRRRAGTTPWTPDVTAPAWQTGNTFSWTPASADVGTWEIIVWVKDGNTPANANTYGYAAYANAGPVKVVTPPLTLTVTGSPAYATAGNTITWTATAGGGTPSTTQYALFRRRSGATAWTPDVTAPAWQTSNILSWTTTSADVGTWEIVVWVKDGDTPATMNTYGYAAYANAGPVQVVAPLSLTVTGSPASSIYGNALTWTATASGGVPSTTQYAFFRRRAGATAWTPDVTAPAWQASNTYTWTPTSADIGTWETYVWVKDGNTPANQNTYGYAAGFNSGPVRVVAPITGLNCPGTSSGTYGNTFTWVCSVTGGDSVTLQYALFRRRAGTTTWTPSVTTPAWQSSNVLSWTPTSSDVGTWELYVWVRDYNTPANANTYGYSVGNSAGNAQVLAPISVTGTGSPAYSTYGTTITWTANASGGDPATYQYAFFRRRSGATVWTPDVTTPAWQASNVMSWTPSSADTGTWEIIIWVKDGNTPASMNTYGYAAYYNAGPVQVVAPVGLSGTSSPSASYYGQTLSWTLNASGGVPSTRQYAFFRRRAGATSWTPDVTAPSWTTSNNFSWTPSSTDTGTWEIVFWVKDASTKPNQNTYGYSAYYNAGPVQVVTPPSLSGTGSPSQAYYGQTLTWTANVSGGTGTNVRYAFFRRRAGSATWTPDVNSPAWQTSNTYSWTPTSADVDTWETYVWVKDSATPSNMNTYGYAAGYNSGPVQIVAPAPLTVSGTGSPSSSPWGTTLTWTATTSGGVPSTVKYALFRRRAGTSNWIPDVTAPAWQSSRTLSWTPSSADVGTWEIIIWVKDVNTSPTQNTYGYAAYYNAGPVQVY